MTNISICFRALVASNATPSPYRCKKDPHQSENLLALHEKFKQEIHSIVKAGILTEVTPEMSMPEWLNSFVIVKKPNGNLRVCLDPTDLN